MAQRTGYRQRPLEERRAAVMEDLANLAKISWLLRTFGEGCPKGLVIWAVMPLSHFWGYHSDRFFNSIH
jgi:hypothetical protein